MYLSIIIPAYNEEKRLPGTLEKILEYLNHSDYLSGKEVEILVVDDGSKDKTVSVVEDFAKKDGRVKVIANQPNSGKGSVVRKGMLEAKGMWRLMTDADNSTPIDQVEKLLKVAEQEKLSVVIGSRYLRKDSIKIKQPWKRRVLSRASNLLIQALLLPGVKDTQCGFKLFSAEAVEKIFPYQSVNGWSFDVEILAIGRKLGYKEREVPVDWHDSSDSRLRAVSAVMKSFSDLMVIYRKMMHFKS